MRTYEGTERRRDGEKAQGTRHKAQGEGGTGRRGDGEKAQGTRHKAQGEGGTGRRGDGENSEPRTQNLERSQDPGLRTQDSGPITQHAARSTQHSALGTPGRQSYLVTTARNLLTLREVEDLATSMPEIRMLLLKGLALLPLYPRMGARALSDADVLIDPGDLPAARRLLGRLGFRPEPIHNEEYDSEFYRELAFVRDAEVGLFRLDLHWGLISGEWYRDRGIPTFKEIWSRSWPGPFDLETVRVPSPEDTLLHLCLHQALHHSFGESQPYLDIALLTTADRRSSRLGRDDLQRDRAYGLESACRQGIDWELFLRLAQGSGWRAAVYWTLERARRLAGAPIPEELLRQLAPGRLRLRLIGALAGHLPTLEAVSFDCDAPHPDMTEGGVGQQAGRLLQLALVDRVADAAVMAARALYPSERWLRLRHPEYAEGSGVALRFRYALRLASLVARAMAQLGIRRSRTLGAQHRYPEPVTPRQEVDGETRGDADRPGDRGS